MAVVTGAVRFGTHRVLRGKREALGGRPGGFAISLFLKGRGFILPRRAWYEGCEAKEKLKVSFLQRFCTVFWTSAQLRKYVGKEKEPSIAAA